MAIDIDEVVNDSLQDVASLRAVPVCVALFVIGLGTTVVSQSTLLYGVGWVLQVTNAPPDIAADITTNLLARFPFALDLGIGPILGLVVGIALVNEFVRLVAIRMFASEMDVPFPVSDVREDLGGAAKQALLLGGTVGILASLPVIGFVLGPVLNLVFVYLRQEIALGDGGFAATIKRSLTLFLEDPLKIILILAGLGLANNFAVQSVASGDPTGLWALLLNLVTLLVWTVFAVLGIAIVTRAYDQVDAAHSPG
jgi:hypothetical protein